MSIIQNKNWCISSCTFQADWATSYVESSWGGSFPHIRNRSAISPERQKYDIDEHPASAISHVFLYATNPIHHEIWMLEQLVKEFNPNSSRDFFKKSCAGWYEKNLKFTGLQASQVVRRISFIYGRCLIWPLPMHVARVHVRSSEKVSCSPRLGLFYGSISTKSKEPNENKLPKVPGMFFHSSEPPFSELGTSTTYKNSLPM